MDRPGDSLDWLLRALAQTEPVDSIPVAAGTMIGRYRLTTALGRGGFGIVFKALDTQLEREVALKVLHSSRGDEKAEQRLMREAQAMARLKHENLLTVYDVGSFAPGQLFVAMELVDGGSLRHWLEERPRSPSEIVAMFLKAGAGLAAAHRAGVVHRDFKPDNVLVGNDGAVRVADFGLAVLTGREGDSFVGGTPRYMAPEQVRGDAPNPKMDQFSFGVALWEALSGAHPLADATRSTRLPPQRLRAPLRRACAPDGNERFATMEELLAELQPPPPRASRRRDGDIIEIIEAAYRLEEPEADWMLEVGRLTQTQIGREDGLYVIRYEVTPADRVTPGEIVCIGLEPSLIDLLRNAASAFPPELVRESLPKWPCTLASRIGGPEEQAAMREGIRQWYGELGWRDFFQVNAFDPSNSGVMIGIPLRREGRLSATTQARWNRVATHLAAANRLRRRLDTVDKRRAETADAILTPSGKLEHAGAAAQTAGAQEALRVAVQAVDQARSRMRREDPDGAIAAWKGMIDARWTLIDHVESDGKRYVLARRNDVDTRDQPALDALERQALAFAALGHEDTLLAYELGLAPTALTALLRRARAKLGET
jgi:serine/threonine protein kinase